MGNRLFKRFLSLSLIRPTSLSIGDGSIFFVELPNAITISDLQVKFKIEKTLSRRPNKASVTATGLNEDTRAAFTKKPLIVRLAVGYDGEENLQHLFSGDLRVADTIHDGPHVETTFEMGDGDRAYEFAHISQSFGGTSRLIDAVSATAKELQLPLPPGLDKLPAMQTPFSGVLHGPAKDVMSKLLTPIGSSWSIQDGKLIALADTQVLEGEAVVIREGDGMIGSPKISVGKKPGDGPVMHVRTLIDPRIRAGGKVKVESREVNGVFRVEKLDHSGEFRGKEWYTTVIGKPV